MTHIAIMWDKKDQKHHTKNQIASQKNDHSWASQNVVQYFGAQRYTRQILQSVTNL